MEATIKPATSTFGGTLGATSAFSSKTGTSFGSGSGFGGLGGSGFGGSSGSGFGGGSKLSSFASPAGGSLSGSSKPVRAFGAPVNDDDAEEEDGEDGEDKEAAIKSPKDDEENEKDGRFFAQDGKLTHVVCAKMAR